MYRLKQVEKGKDLPGRRLMCQVETPHDQAHHESGVNPCVLGHKLGDALSGVSIPSFGTGRGGGQREEGTQGQVEEGK
jgi:hypothetical protein